MTPSFLADRAREIAVEFEAVTTEVLGREEIVDKGLGGLAAVAAGSEQEPKLICLRYAGRGSGEVLGLVGKAVTFDSGGISIKPSKAMHEMKMDMSGGAAVLETVAAIAELGLELDVVAVIPSTENMPSGTATRPGDIITQLNGKTVEVNNTDAEGRLILADALTWCVREMGADRVVDIATLTGAVLIALGSTYAALVSNDDALAAAVDGLPERTGELAWRLPLHPEYKELTKGTVADLANTAQEARGRNDLRRLLPRGVRRRPPVGPSRHRRHRLGHRPRVRGQGAHGIRRTPPHHPGPGLSRLAVAGSSGPPGRPPRGTAATPRARFPAAAGHALRRRPASPQGRHGTASPGRASRWPGHAATSAGSRVLVRRPRVPRHMRRPTSRLAPGARWSAQA